MEPVEAATVPPSNDVDEFHVADFDSVAIQRLISEVRSDEPSLVGPRYDRTYNRHNR
jgi:hypothetical protein